MKPYLVRNSYFAQIEASALVNLRLGYTCLGVASWPTLGRKADQRWWQRLFPLLSLALWSHTGQCDQRWVFRLTLFRRLVIGYRTRGDATPALDAYHDAGLYLFSRCGHRRRLAPTWGGAMDMRSNRPVAR